MNPCVGTRLGVPRGRSVARRELKRDFESLAIRRNSKGLTAEEVTTTAAPVPRCAQRFRGTTEGDLIGPA